MATYVTSDAHGHVRALDRALELAAPGSEDTVFVLGDMVDRGPDPVGVIRLVRSLPGAQVLMGNHERMMLDVLAETGGFDDFIWGLNGGATTARGFDRLPPEELGELVDWIAHLPLFAVVETDERPWILVHAGIDALEARGYLATAGVAVSDEEGAAAATADDLRAMMASQDPETLLWTRAEFWSVPTGLVGGGRPGPCGGCRAHALDLPRALRRRAGMPGVSTKTVWARWCPWARARRRAAWQTASTSTARLRRVRARGAWACAGSRTGPCSTRRSSRASSQDRLCAPRRRRPADRRPTRPGRAPTGP